MPQISYNFLFAHKRSIFVHEAYIEPNNAQYHNYLCANLAFTYITNYPELFVTQLHEDALTQLQRSSAIQRKKLIDKYLIKKLIQLADFQQYSLEYSLLATLTQLDNKGFYHCIAPINCLDSHSIIKKIIVENFEIKEILTSWQDEFFYAAPSQRIILNIRNRKPKTPTATIYFTQVYNFENIEELGTTFDKIETFTKTAENIAFSAQETHITWAVGTEFLFKNGNAKNWSKFLKMSKLYGNLLAKCRYMLTPFKNTTTIAQGFSFAHSEFYPLIPIHKTKKTTTVLNTSETSHEIENKYLRHVISNANELNLVTQKVENIGQLAFYCNKNKTELQQSKDEFTNNYITKLTTQITSQTTTQETQKADNQDIKKWYVPKQTAADALADLKMTSCFHWVENHENYLHTNSIIGLSWKKESIKYFLRSSFWQFWLENEVAILETDGFTFSIEKLADILVINPDLLNTEAIKLIYNDLESKSISLIPETLQNEQIEIQKLDLLIAEALGLETDLLTALHQELQAMYHQRQHIQTVMKKHKNAKNFIKTVKTYIDTITSGNKITDKDFPDFVSTYQNNHSSIKFESYHIDKQAIKVLDFLGNYEIYQDKALLFTTNSKLKFEFIKLYILGATTFLEVPENEEDAMEMITNFKQKMHLSNNIVQNFAKEKLVSSWAVTKSV